eukprot:m.412464 g.412464  ORF g.412464 m.412464 type:complete len:630 (+) comp28855_c0_seq1:43-1932(+)
MGSARTVLLAVAAVVSVSLEYASGFYIPGVAPVEYKLGDNVRVMAVKMTSTKHPLPYEYYYLPFCRPDKLVHRPENLGEVLRGDRITNTPYDIKMGTNVTCQVLCKRDFEEKQVKRFRKFIKNDYRAHWLIDNLPSATKLMVDDEATYLHGFPIGYEDESAASSTNLFNHVTIVVKTHRTNEESVRIVGFEIKAGSFAAKSYSVKDDQTCTVSTNGGAVPQPMKLTDPKSTPGKQQVIFSYGVRFEESEIAWASRWDTYLHMSDTEIHWFSIINSFITVLFLSAIFGVIIVRTLSQDIAKYNEEDDDDVEPTGWKLVHGDVFRTPAHYTLLATFTGTGIQLLGMLMVTLMLALFGMLSPSSRGALVTVAVVTYMLMGLVAGYYSARMYKTMGGQQWKMAAASMALTFPMILFGVCFILNFFLWGKQSSGAVPFTTMIILLIMWFGGSVPLIMTGSFFGFRKEAYSYPVSINQIPRQIPTQPWFLNGPVAVMLAGILPFGAIFIELFFILNAIWENQFYYMFGFLFLVFMVLIISCSEITIVMAYMQLCAEDYHWWWRSFFVSGGCAFYVWLYAMFYFFTKLEVTDTVSTIIYVGYTTLMSLGFFFLTGTIGFYSTFFFVTKIYGAVKID